MTNKKNLIEFVKSVFENKYMSSILGKIEIKFNKPSSIPFSSSGGNFSETYHGILRDGEPCFCYYAFLANSWVVETEDGTYNKDNPIDFIWFDLSASVAKAWQAPERNSLYFYWAEGLLSLQQISSFLRVVDNDKWNEIFICDALELMANSDCEGTNKFLKDHYSPLFVQEFTLNFIKSKI